MPASPTPRRMGRPIGSGGATIRIAPRADQGGARLFIGAALYHAIGSPARVDVTAGKGTLVVRPGTTYAVSGVRVGQARIAIGVLAAATLGLDADHEAVYPARAFPRSGRIVAPIPATT